MDGCETIGQTVKVLKIGGSIPPGMLTITTSGNALHAGLQSANNNVNNSVNLVDLGKKLLDACRNGETDEVRSLMQSGAPFTTDWLGTSPLHFAAQQGHSETAEVLLRAGVSRDTRTKVDRTPLHVASQEGHLTIVNLLLMHGADVDAKDLLKMTPIHWAVERGHEDVVECLLNHGADVSLTSKFDKTPIDIALDAGRVNMVPILQKFVNVSRPKAESKQSPANSKSRPTVLPNKANRTSKPKPVQQLHNHHQILHHHQQQNHTTHTTSSPIKNSNAHKTVNLDDFKKLLASSGIAGSPIGATLTVLAEAASNTNSNDTAANEALQWLENQVKPSTNSNDNLCHSALESGQNVSLTEAGKLALNWVKGQKASVGPAQASNSGKANKVYTIVSDGAQLPQIIGGAQAAPIVLVSGGESNELNSNKLRKPIRLAKPITSITTPTPSSRMHSSLNSKQVTLTPVNKTHPDSEQLQKELELVRKQAEEYKNQLTQKSKEAEHYKRQLEAFKSDCKCKS